jgi:RHS repeat-associated protein
MIEYIENPLGKRMNFYYNAYALTANNVNYGPPPYNSSTLIDLELNNLNRINMVENYSGGIRKYYYIDNGHSTVDYYVSYAVRSSIFKGQGRDPFFVNMIIRKQSKNSLYSDSVSSEGFDYGYDDEGTNSLEQPLDMNDIMTTTRIRYSLTSNAYNTPPSIGSVKSYRNYPIYTNVTNREHPDYQGEIKMYQENFIKGGENPGLYKLVEYDFDKNYNPAKGLCDGSFLDSQIKETIDGVSKTENFQYEYSENFPSTNSHNNPVTKVTKIDALGNKTITEFSNILEKSLCYIDAACYDNNLTIVPIYLIKQPYIIERKDSQDNLLYKETNQYALAGDTNTSYFGQLLNHKIYDINDLDNYLQTEYKYYKRDTVGNYIYYSGIRVGREGNLKETISPQGSITKYYYHPISATEETKFGTPQETNMEGTQFDGPYSLPKISYKKVFEDGTYSIISSEWQDRRLPTRIDNYVSEDNYITSYNYYNEAGNITRSVNNNGYISTFTYDPLDRVTMGTLPLDFNTSEHDSTVYDTAYTTIVDTLFSTGWGFKNDFGQFNNPPTTHLLQSNPDLLDGKFKLYNYGSTENPDNPDDKKSALIQFSNFNNIKWHAIEYAYLIFYPGNFEIYVDGSSSPSSCYLQFHPLKKLYNSGTSLNYEFGSGYSDYSDIIIGNDVCSNCTGWRDNYENNYNKIDITNLTRLNLPVTTAGIEGFILQAHPFNNPQPDTFSLKMNLNCCFDSNTGYDWSEPYSPRIDIKGSEIKITQRIIKVFQRGTLRYTYDDASHRVTVLSKLDNSVFPQRDKMTKTYFDGFYKPVQTNSYFTVDTSSKASFYTEYNYLDQKAKTIDAKGYETKFSYNEFGTNSKTENEDDSYSFVTEGFYDTLITHWGTYTGFIHKQVFTDETGRNFEKYFDAVGNLLREVKFLDENVDPDNPYDHDTTVNNGYDNPPNTVSLFTDYRYDNLYRVTGVYTPNYKTIEYQYDAFGRQSQRTTPDAGITKYIYDKNGNLIFSQDANQRSIASNIYTYRQYDGLSRLLGLGVTRVGQQGIINFDEIDPYNLPEMDSYSVDSMLTVNAYDTLSSAIAAVFSNIPTDYYSSINNTKGLLCATAFRDKITDSWNFKFYRYDARGRVKKMWTYIPVLGWKSIIYDYNSQNQVTYINYNPVGTDRHLYRNNYDDAARLKDVSLYTGVSIPPEDSLQDFIGTYANLTKYGYNENSQIAYQNFNDSSLSNHYIYNNRNWVQTMKYFGSGNEIYHNALIYLTNGNIRIQKQQGNYMYNFPDYCTTFQLRYVYDLSNRLVRADRDTLQLSTKHDLINTYDRDGNLQTLKRYGSNNNLVDNFNYSYFSGTNRLAKTVAGVDQYSYDYNGNAVRDDMNGISNMFYDHRNLLLSFRSVRLSSGGISPPVIFETRYWYDEAGNRIHKLVKRYNGVEQNPIYIENDDPFGLWQTITDEYYARDASGKEMAIYQGTTLDFWNMWGLDNFGKINANGSRFFYLKDHLGTVRAVVNQINDLVSAQDYDAWGYPMENRSFTNGRISFSKTYEFTGKERDDESNYDYFGARYYDARVANWTSLDPLFEKHIGWTPYNYVLRSPLRLIDPDGKQVDYQWRQGELLNGGGWVDAQGIGISVVGTALLINSITQNGKNQLEQAESKSDDSKQGTREEANNKSKERTVDQEKEKTASELISGKGKKSKSYHEELGNKTYDEIKNMSKDKNDPLQQAAKQMKKLIEQSRGRLKEKSNQTGRY